MYTYWYSTYTIGNTTYFDYSHKQFTGYDYSEVCTSSSSSGGLPYLNPSGPNSARVYKKRNTNQSSAEDTIVLVRDEVEDEIDDSMLKPCMISILTELKSLTTGISHIIVKFSEAIPNYNWILKDASLSGQTGTTDPPTFYSKATGSITTIFDSKAWPDATDLSWARTMLHESVHANLATEFALNRPNFIANYPTMVAEWGKLQNWNDVHHQEIARSIVNDVAIALEEYGKNEGYNLTKQFYQDMSWGGLQDTSTFKSLSPTDQKRILNTISTELTGRDINGDVKSQKGKNAGC